MALSYADCIQVPTTVVYTGKLTYAGFAKDEMITLVLPAGIAPDAPVGLYYQWTIDAKGVPKRNQVDVGKLSGVQNLADGTVAGVFKAYYNYQFSSADGNSVSIVMSACDGFRPQTISLQRAECVKSPAGRKKVRARVSWMTNPFVQPLTAALGIDRSLRRRIRHRHLHGEGDAHQVPWIRGHERRDAVL